MDNEMLTKVSKAIEYKKLMVPTSEIYDNNMFSYLAFIIAVVAVITPIFEFGDNANINFIYKLIFVIIACAIGAFLASFFAKKAMKRAINNIKYMYELEEAILIRRNELSANTIENVSGNEFKEYIVKVSEIK